MIAFLDTEFTDLFDRPRLLSVGIVVNGQNGREFYAEITDAEHIAAASRFVKEQVLPQFGKVADAPCTYAELGVRVACFFAELEATLGPDEFIDVAFECQLDWDLLLRAVQDSRAPEWGWTRHFVRPANIFDIEESATGKASAAAYFRAQQSAPFSRHHALCDARALCIAHDPLLLARARESSATSGRTRA